jgi:GAF domain-containing protein
LLTTIEKLEEERQALLTHSEEAERQARVELARAAATESELANLASLYVASSQLHASLDPREVIQTMGQLLLQFVGAGEYVIYNAQGKDLVPVMSEGIPLERLRVERVGEGPIGSCFMVQDVVATPERRDEHSPLATVPLRIGDEPVGCVAVFGLLEQKEALTEPEFELLRMVATQGATALAGARLYAAANGSIPKLTAVESLVGSR